MNVSTLSIKTRLSVSLAALALALAGSRAAAAEEQAKLFDTPEAAVAALEQAAKACDRGAIQALFGPAGEDLENPDRVQATNDMRTFLAALEQSRRIVRDSESRCTLEVGNESWPFPVPVIRKDGKWFFDAEAGKDELLSRRIGRNELSTLGSMRAYVDAQRDYAAKDRDGDEVLEYAQKLVSAPSLKDGLYWPSDLDGEISPLGPFVAQAQSEGYAGEARKEGAGPEPFHGYTFKVLTAQAKAAPGGKYSYLINGNMIGGFALIAWPASYGETGVMTFIVNQQGRVYQKDLGSGTGKAAPKIKAYDPDKTWSVSSD